MKLVMAIAEVDGLEENTSAGVVVTLADDLLVAGVIVVIDEILDLGAGLISAISARV